MNILFTSIAGNTRSFLNRLQKYNETIHLKEIDDNTPEDEESEPFFVFVPTYLEGGNGIDNGDQEIMTEALREYIEFKENSKLCLGIIGSGNKNFNEQYCLTAKQYAEEFKVPLLDDFELRGTNEDVKRIDETLRNAWTK
ncbi:class Ib ribonucleoside-diphosphate reductase assembly flavoprotein NrdI [Tetragenococcus halophilus]|uniref:class Ib ribonucleoside-diphosphate reductase assembly flavoprotein NrdI n=1 Tax=Tetragenococcus halophilus TaxID=51669 RepID=UPI00300FD314